MKVLDCRSQEGEAVGIIDALITIMRQAAKVDMSLPQVREALKDLYDDKATARVMGPIYDKIRRGEHAAGRNRLNVRADLNFGRDGRRWHSGGFRFRADPDTPDLGISMGKIKP